MTTDLLIRGTDTDNYDGAIPASHFQKLYDQYAVRFNIIGLEAQMPFAIAQRDASLAVGVDVPFAYKFLYWTANDIERIKQAAGFGKPVAIDCEVAVPTSWQIPQVVQRIHEARDALIAEGLYWGIYTGAWWWPANTGDSKDFSGDKLWHAAYPYGEGVLPPVTYMPTDFTGIGYGGWPRAEVLQYSDVCYEDYPPNANGWHLDMNAYQGQPVVVPPPEKWLYGDKSGGAEKRGNQIVEWNNFVETDKHGDEAGLTPGLWTHNAGSAGWIKLAD